MDLNEYIKQLAIEPNSDDPAMVEARRSSVQHAKAAKAAHQFEAKLLSALRLPHDAGLADAILDRCFGKGHRRSHRPRWIAVAAALVVALGLTLSLNQGPSQAQILQAAFIEHLNVNEPGSMTSTALVEQDHIAAVFAHANTHLQGPVEDVTFAALCPIGGQPGAHIVITDDNGDRTTVMLIPAAELEQKAAFEIDGMSAEMQAVDSGVMAVFGHQGQDITAISELMAQRITVNQIALNLLSPNATRLVASHGH